MNESHDAPLDDDQVITRLRAALDEVTAEPRGIVPVRRRRSGSSAGRWMAAAAAVILVVGAVTAIVINRRNSPGVASTPTVTAAPATTDFPTTTTATATATTPVGNWYVLASPDLIAEPYVTESCCAPGPAPGPGTVTAWAATTGVQDGVLLLRSQPLQDGTSTVKYMSYGLSDARTEELKSRVVEGSGLPYVLLDDSMVLIGFGLDGMGNQTSQRYANATGAVTITVGDYRGQLTPLVLGGRLDPVTIAGTTGYRYTEGGVVRVVWRTPAGQWATLEISPALADRADGLIAAVTEQVADPAPVEPIGLSFEEILSVEGVSLPSWEAGIVDTALGATPPMLESQDADGNRSVLAPGVDGPTLVVFVAEWCPHCRATVKQLQQALTDGTTPADVEVVLVVSASERDAAISWLTEEGWADRVLIDAQVDENAAGPAAAAYGATGWPHWVMVGPDGTVTSRAAGELSAAELQALTAPLPDGTLGQLTIPTIGFDFPVVRSSAPTNEPSLSRGPAPDTATPQALSTIDVGTPGGTVPNLEALHVGDQFTWTSPTGTIVFEMTGGITCTGADCSPADDETLMLLSDEQLTRIWAKPVG